MSRFSGRSRTDEQLSEAVCDASELLEVLWGRGQEATPAVTVSPSQLRALLVIEQDEGTNLRALGEAIGSSPPSVSRLCDRMEAMGLVERRPSRTSRREVELSLSPRGRVLLRESRANRKREVAAVLAVMGPAALDALTEGLAAFRAAAAQIEGRRGASASDGAASVANSA
ncbi:MarR family winged helix-turn-helix transcriptional regulator [Streptomyces uncialis]|uniref:MarR family winged helix-turn-helix transcriptional regulator n=1 Tax=Streptomyces uncialis TaxID=1048205 RepID=UPI00365304F7